MMNKAKQAVKEEETEINKNRNFCVLAYKELDNSSISTQPEKIHIKRYKSDHRNRKHKAQS